MEIMFCVDSLSESSESTQIRFTLVISNLTQEFAGLLINLEKTKMIQFGDYVRGSGVLENFLKEKIENKVSCFHLCKLGATAEVINVLISEVAGDIGRLVVYFHTGLLSKNDLPDKVRFLADKGIRFF